jgi:hypothetical protein
MMFLKGLERWRMKLVVNLLSKPEEAMKSKSKSTHMIAHDDALDLL